MKTRLMMFVAVIALFVFNGCSDSKESYVKDFKNSQKNGKIWINKVSVWY